MTAEKKPTVIKKYANRRLYHTGTSTYVTLDDLAGMVKGGEDFVVFDAKTGEEITRSVLAQIIFEQEGKSGQNLLPITFLRQLIRYYGDSMQALVPSYLEFSLADALAEPAEVPRAALDHLRAEPVRRGGIHGHGRAGAEEHGDVPRRAANVHALSRSCPARSRRRSPQSQSRTTSRPRSTT